MTFTARDWVRAAGAAAPVRRFGSAVVFRTEVGKLVRQWRVRAVALVCVGGPFAFAAAVKVQGSVPQDTLFGQWVHETGLATPLVVLGFSGQWALPLVAAIVAGDVFSSEDHFGTWKAVLTRSRTRGEVFGGKAAAALAYTVAAVVLLAAASVAAGAALGLQPVVGLGGQLVPSGRAVGLTWAAWALQLPPTLGFAGFAILCSVLSRNSVVGIGVPVLVGLAMQLSTFVALPLGLRDALLGTGFGTWHALWVPRPFLGQVVVGIVVGAAWLAVGLVVSWLVFLRRTVRVSA